MPWTAADAKRFKKGLTAKQARQWAHIANSALRSCLAGGGSQQSCEASAIRQANGVAGHSEFIDVYYLPAADYQVQTTEHQGRKHIVVPVIMMVEGVHNGSLGPLLHLGEDLSRFPNSWDGIPVVIDHPEIDGMFVSANLPALADNGVVGRVYNTNFEDGKLKAEAWLDEEKLKDASPEAYADIMGGEPLEVSVGVFTDEDQESGEWHNEHYEAIARNYRPDHLALLPGAVGACSWRDGCGIRANKEKSSNDKKGGDILDAKKVEFSLNGEIIRAVLENQNEYFDIDVNKDYMELVNALQRHLNSMDNSQVTHYLRGVDDEFATYEVRKPDGKTEFYRQKYEVNEDQTVALVETPVKVRRKVEYVTVQSDKSSTQQSINLNKGGSNMADKKKTPCEKCEKKVDALIANKQTKWAEDDREYLLTLEEDVIDKMTPEEVKNDEPVSQDAPQPTKEQVMEVMKELGKDIETYMGYLPEEVREEMRVGLAMQEQRRNDLIEKIITNTDEGTWEEDTLKKMSFDMLERIANSIKVSVDYSVNRESGKTSKAEKVEPLLPTGFGTKN